MRIGFTATRQLPEQRSPKHVAIDEILNRYMPLDDEMEFTTGCAFGGDTYLALTLLDLFPLAHHRLAIPAAPHNNELVKRLRALSPLPPTRHIELVKCNRGRTDAESYRIRNAVILDHSDFLCGFPNRTEKRDKRSGTYMTLRMASERGIPTLTKVLNP